MPPTWPGRRHDLPGERALAGDHDKLPVTGADREGMGVMLLENAQDVGDLLAIIWAGPTPADNNPLADIGRSTTARNNCQNRRKGSRVPSGSRIRAYTTRT